MFIGFNIKVRKRWSRQLRLLSISCGIAVVGLVNQSLAQNSQLEKALSYRPRNAVEFTEINRADFDECKGKETRLGGVPGYLVTGPNGEKLRWFCDNDADKSVDQWSYFSNGIEVHRELDTDGNGVADAYRWLGTAGTRWGIDKNEDGVVDNWKVISAEEVTSEIVQAIQTADLDRFASLLPAPSELRKLGLSDENARAISNRVEKAADNFVGFARQQKVINSKTRWTNFGAERPGLIPAGTDGSTKDVIVYENVVAVFESTPGKPQQLLIGTLIQTDSGWRTIDLPKTVEGASVVTDGGLFFTSSNASAAGARVAGGMSERMQQLLTELDKIDSEISGASGRKLELLHNDRADLLEKLISQSGSNDERATWVRQFADTVGAAAQAGEFKNGLKRLTRLQNAISKAPNGKQLGSYVAFRTIEATYSMEVAKPDANYQQIEKDHLRQLEQFVKNYPDSENSAEALVRIGLSNELAGDIEDAKRYYQRAARDYKETSQGKKARGAVSRLGLVGQKMRLTGKTLDGEKFDSGKYKGKPVIIHYWASWCTPCKQDMEKLRRLQASYARQGLVLVGINVDENPEAAKNYLRGAGSKIAWDHLYEEGGMESNLAVGLGVLSLPVTLLIDDEGKVAESTTHYTSSIEQKIKEMTSKP